MSRRSNVGAVAIVVGLTLAIDAVADAPFFADLIAAGLVFTVGRAALEHAVDELDRDDQDERDDEPIGARDARDAFVEGEIGVDELEKRLDRAFDPDVRRIVERYEQADGVGVATCERLADEYGTVESIERADVDELADQVDGIGPKRAESIATVDE